MQEKEKHMVEKMSKEDKDRYLSLSDIYLKKSEMEKTLSEKYYSVYNSDINTLGSFSLQEEKIGSIRKTLKNLNCEISKLDDELVDLMEKYENR